jgi:hypothetical protein
MNTRRMKAPMAQMTRFEGRKVGMVIKLSLPCSKESELGERRKTKGVKQMGKDYLALYCSQQFQKKRCWL